MFLLRDLKFKLDTGAEVTAISKEDYKKLKKPPLSPPKKILYGPSQQTLKSIGQFLGEFSHKSNLKVIRQPIFVIDGLRTNLLGLPAITALGLAIRVDATESDTPLEEVQKEFPTVFQGLGNLGEEFEMHLKSGATPYCLFTPRNVPIPLRPKVQEELDRMESLGVIRKVDEPTPWCAGMVVVPKKEGAIRICVDLKPLNETSFGKYILFQRLMIPNLQEQSSSANWMPTADSGRYVLPRNPSSSPHYNLKVLYCDCLSSSMCIHVLYIVFLEAMCTVM